MNTRKHLGFYIAIAGLVFTLYLAGLSMGKGEIIAGLLFAGAATISLIMAIVCYLNR